MAKSQKVHEMPRALRHVEIEYSRKLRAYHRGISLREPCGAGHQSGKRYAGSLSAKVRSATSTSTVSHHTRITNDTARRLCRRS